MSTSALLPNLTPQLPQRNEGNAAKNLQVGQVLFGKVLRVYQDGSYLVDLNGQQHIVDSAIPLRQDEVFRGKIIGLGEHVVLEKMITVEGESSPKAEIVTQFDELTKNLAQDLKTFVEQHQNTFSASNWKTLVRVANQAKQPQLVLAAAVYLQKIGMPFNTELSKKLADYLSRDTQLKSLKQDEALHLDMNMLPIKNAAQTESAIALIADYLKQKTEETLDRARDILKESKAQETSQDQSKHSVDADSGDSAGSQEQEFNQSAFQWLMNTQTGGAVSHRLVVLPLVIDGHPIELEMSLFDQNKNTHFDSDLKHKVIHLSLDMAQLGKINATITAVNQNLRVHFSSPSEDGLHMLAAHNQHLARQLQELDCQLDEFTYTVERSQPDQHHVTRPVVDLIVNSDTLSMLV
jgi:hypothetical protein